MAWGGGGNPCRDGPEVIGTSTPSTLSEPGHLGPGCRPPNPKPRERLKSTPAAPWNVWSRRGLFQKKVVVTERKKSGAHWEPRRYAGAPGKRTRDASWDLKSRVCHRGGTGVPGRECCREPERSLLGVVVLLLSRSPGIAGKSGGFRTTSSRSSGAGRRAGQGWRLGCRLLCIAGARVLERRARKGPRGCRDAEIRETGEDWGR